MPKLLPIYNRRNQVVGYKQADERKRRRRKRSKGMGKVGRPARKAAP